MLPFDIRHPLRRYSISIEKWQSVADLQAVVRALTYATYKVEEFFRLLLQIGTSSTVDTLVRPFRISASVWPSGTALVSTHLGGGGWPQSDRIPFRNRGQEGALGVREIALQPRGSMSFLQHRLLNINLRFQSSTENSHSVLWLRAQGAFVTCTHARSYNK
jgi:hypothetical protein